MKRKAVTDDEKYLSHIDMIKNQIERATDIIDSILRLTRMEAPSLEPTDLAEAARAAIEAAKLQHGIDVEWDVPAGGVIARADGNQLNLAFKNIIKNAAQEMGGDGTLTVVVKTVSEGGAGWAEVSFADTGTGIEEENLAKIFTPLFTTKAYGIGFGLSIAKIIIEKHGGTISTASKRGEGTVFTIRLPAEQQKEGK